MKDLLSGIRRLLRKTPAAVPSEHLKPGDNHYRAYVGPVKDYDLISAMVMNLLTGAGVRAHHSVLDVGCGSLRIGRMLIPYLNTGNYIGVEPNKWLVMDGIRHETGRDIIDMKRPHFIFSDSIATARLSNIDFAIAQSVFSHTSAFLFAQWLRELSAALAPTGCLFATVITADQDSGEEGWVYPGCVSFSHQTIENLAKEAGFVVHELVHWHPRQTWFCFAKPHCDTSFIHDGVIAWQSVR